jgi:hypothetical protein
VGSRSVISFLVRLGLVVYVVFESSTSVGGAHGFLLPYLFFVVSCSYLVMNVQICLLCVYLVGSVGGAFASTVLLLPIISAWVSCGHSVSTIKPVRLLSILCRIRCFSEFVLSLSK